VHQFDPAQSKSAAVGMRTGADAFLAVTAREKRGEGSIDYWWPFEATAKLLKTAHFSRARSDLDPPSQRKVSCRCVPDELNVFRSDQRATKTQKAHEPKFVGFLDNSW